MHQKFSRRTCSQWTPVNKRYIALCVFYFFDNQNHKNHKYMSELTFGSFLSCVTCHSQWNVYWERSLHQVVLLKVWGLPPAPLVGGGSTMKIKYKSFKSLSGACWDCSKRIWANMTLASSTWDWTRLAEKLRRFGASPDMERPPVHLKVSCHSAIDDRVSPLRLCSPCVPQMRQQQWIPPGNRVAPWQFVLNHA